VGVEATVTFANPGGSPETATLISVAERDSFRVTSIFANAPTPTYPVEFQVLDSGIGYIRMNSNYDDLGLIVRLFEYALKQFTAGGITNLIIDMRYNSGGAPLGLAGLFYDQEILLGQLEYFSETTGQFEPEGLPDKVLPNRVQYPFEKIAILVGPACASACELEAYGFAQVPGAAVVGMYPSAGVEAEVARGQYQLPEGISVQIPTGRFVNPDGSLFLEGAGVVPTVKVPITEKTVLTAEDVVLSAAMDAVLGVDPNDVKLESGLVLGSKATTNKAIRANTDSLEARAQENYSADDLAQMDKTFPYTIALESKRQRLLWAWGWCTTSTAILNENYKHIKLEFSINGEAVDPASFFEFQQQGGGLFCKSYYIAAYNWPSGETTLQTVVTFDATINDGQADYPAGKQTFVYTVTAP
jgi:hypothetical protein